MDDSFRTARFAKDYGTDARFDREMGCLFPSVFSFLADTDELSEPGLLPCTFMPGSLGERLLLTRDESGLRCISNVCSHRGAVICQAARSAKSFRCPYHGRRFTLDGRVKNAPGFEKVEGFPGAEDHLPSVVLEQLGPLLFTSLTPRDNFSELTEAFSKRLAFLPLDSLRKDPTGTRDFTINAHWALWADNYLEGFHIPFVHPGLSRALSLSSYEVELYRYSSLQIGEARGDDICFDLPEGHPDAGRRIAAYYLFLFPFTALNFYPWGLSLNVLYPEGPQRTRVHYRVYEWRSEWRDQGAGAGLDQVEAEDDGIVELTQSGLNSRLYRGGRYAPEHEEALFHFHRYLASFSAAS